MSRSLRKGPYIQEALEKRILAMNDGSKKKEVVKTWSRASMISPDFVGHTIAVHNGNKFIPVYVTENMVGHKLGEFAPTRTFKGHSGTKALVGICQLNESRTAYVDADNWLISPRLSGRAQTLSFWVNNFPQQGYGTESFQVWTSTTDNEKGSFQMLGVDYTQGSGEWTRIEVSLPEGTTYFAIRQNTPASQAFLFMLDDITFEVASQAASYRVYREGSLVGATSATTYQDQGLEEGDYQYAVTAVYPDGSESAPALLTVSTQIPQTEMAKVPAYDVYSVTGAMVRHNASRLNGLPKGVYIVGGRKVVVK